MISPFNNDMSQPPCFNSGANGRLGGGREQKPLLTNLLPFKSEFETLRSTHQSSLKEVKHFSGYIEYINDNKGTIESFFKNSIPGFFLNSLTYCHPTIRKMVCWFANSGLLYLHHRDFQDFKKKFYEGNSIPKKLRKEVKEIQLKIIEHSNQLKKEFELILLDTSFILVNYLFTALNTPNGETINKSLKYIEDIIKLSKDLSNVNINIQLLTKYHTEIKKDLVQDEELVDLLDDCKTSMINKIKKFHDKTSQEIKQHFLKFEIDITIEEINQYLLPSESEGEYPTLSPTLEQSNFQERIKKKQFINSLILKYAKFHKQVSNKFNSGSTNKLIAKLDEEACFSSYDKIEIIFRIFSSITQLILRWNTTSSPITQVLNIFFYNIKEITDPDFLKKLYVFDILYPIQLKNLVVIKVSLIFVRYLFTSQYKKNTCSWEYLLIPTKKKGIDLILRNGLSLVSLFHRSLRWIHIHMIEIYNQRMKATILFNDPRINELIQQYETIDLNLKNQYNNLIKKQKELEEKDINNTLPIDELLENLDNIDINCLSREMIKHIQSHYGFCLTNKTKADLKERITLFYMKDRTQFINTYQRNHSIYGKPQQ